MREITVKAKESITAKKTYLFQIKAYEHEDILTDTFQGNVRNRTFNDILRPAIDHLNTSVTGRAKTKVVRGMVYHIYFYMMRAIIRHILEGDAVEMLGIGTLRMATYRFNNRYRGYSVARQQQKERNRNDMPILLDRGGHTVYYYVSLVGWANRRLSEKIKAGVYYRRKPD